MFGLKSLRSVDFTMASNRLEYIRLNSLLTNIQKGNSRFECTKFCQNKFVPHFYQLFFLNRKFCKDLFWYYTDKWQYVALLYPFLLIGDIQNAHGCRLDVLVCFPK